MEPLVADALAPLLVPIDNLETLPGNPRRGDVEAVSRSYSRFGQRKPIVARPTGERDGHPAGVVTAGNHQLLAARELGWDSIAVVFVDDDELTAEAFAIADNRTHDLGYYDDGDLVAMLTRIAAATEDSLILATGYDSTDLAALIAAANEVEPERPKDGTAPAKRRALPLDAIFTHSIRPICCVAVNAGLKYGIQSRKANDPCPWVGRAADHAIVFVDNDWHGYDHEMHSRFVEEWKPKYATTRDLLDEGQCHLAGVEHYSLGQVLEWAEELSQWAEKVIIIPKYDCIDEIPEEYVLGYSIPTSHGGTNLPLDAFRGRPIHLLGGSWTRQLAYLEALGDDVVSLDNNYITKPAEFGNFCLPGGQQRNLRSLELGADPTNPILISSAMSVGFIAAALRGFMIPEEAAAIPDGAIEYADPEEDDA